VAIRVQAGHRRTAVARDDCKSQAGSANHARGQSLIGSAGAAVICTAVHPYSSDLSKPPESNENIRSEPAWISDITYVRLYREFVYLAVVLDVFSRKVVGWSLGRTLQAKLPLRALDKAIATRRPPPGVVHHSDQGVQYTCRDYMQKLREHRMLPSISRPANPFDNATCESFLKTIKREEIHATVYCDFEDLHNRVLEFIEQYYNRCRLHSALGYRSPERFEKETAESTSEAVCAEALMTFCGT
jgi:transposase InsO family protein